MKMSRIALAMLVAAPLAAANAGVTITPLMVGYTFQDTQHNNSRGNLTNNGQELQDDLFVGAAIGVELTPWLGFEVEYSQVKGDIDAVGEAAGEALSAEYKKQQLAGNFYATSDLITKNYDSKIKPYVLLGAGHVKYEGQGEAAGWEEESTIGNAGLGAFWRLNDALSLRTEARSTYNFDNKFWDYTALAGLNVV
ncbi:MAG: outer membrane beta-barrel protein, partial [Acinetobacter sp.]